MVTRGAPYASSASAQTTSLVTTAPQVPAIGELVDGKYRIQHHIGKGGMGSVFAARHEFLQRDVALKFVSTAATTPEGLARFRNEARALAAIRSDTVANVLDAGHRAAGTPFIALDLLEGDDLARVLQEHAPLPIDDAVGWVLQALEALAEAHALGIVHRDLKPANLFLARRRDGTSVLKVLDFGISKNTAAIGAAPTLTVTASILGSPVYMAPEQLRDAKTVDGRADIWAIGVVLYELLTGRLPFVAQNVVDLCVALLERRPPPLRAARPEIAPTLENVVTRCLSRDIEERFQNVAALAEALAPFAPPGADAAVERIRRVLQAG